MKCALSAKRYFDELSVRKALFDTIERELMAAAEDRRAVQFVAQVAARTPISVGCFCADEGTCHRSRLVEIIRKDAPPA